MKRLALAILIFVAGAQATNLGPQRMPSSPTSVTNNAKVSISDTAFYLVSGATAAVTITDHSTNCSSAACTWVLNLSTASPFANGTWRGLPMDGGFSWSDGCGCVNGWINWQ